MRSIHMNAQSKRTQFNLTCLRIDASIPRRWQGARQCLFVLLCHTGQSRDIDVRHNYVWRGAKCSQDLIFVHADIESGFKALVAVAFFLSEVSNSKANTRSMWNGEMVTELRLDDSRVVFSKAPSVRNEVCTFLEWGYRQWRSGGSSGSKGEIVENSTT